MLDEIVPTSNEPANESQPSNDRNALEAKVSESLKALNLEGDSSSRGESGESVVSTEIASESTDTPVDAVNESNADEQQIVAPKPASPTLPAALARSLKAYEWSEQDIADGYAANPAAFAAMATRIHNIRNGEVEAWAQHGREIRKASGEAPKPAELANGIKAINVDALIEKHGNEDLVREIAEPVNALLAQIGAVLPDLMSGVKHITESRNESLTKQVEQFFGKPDLASYKDFYGTSLGSLTPEQYDRRSDLLELADAVRAGASKQGRKISVEDAMLIAHDRVSASQKTEVIRNEIKKSVTTRNQGITMRPSHINGKSRSGGPSRTESEREKKAAAGLKSVFGG